MYETDNVQIRRRKKDRRFSIDVSGIGGIVELLSELDTRSTRLYAAQLTLVRPAAGTDALDS